MMHPDYKQRPTIEQLLAIPQIAAVPIRREQPSLTDDEPQLQLMGVARMASTPLCLPKRHETQGAQVPISQLVNNLVPVDDAPSVPVADALNFEFTRGEVDISEDDRPCTPVRTPRMLVDESPIYGQTSPWSRQFDDDGDDKNDDQSMHVDSFGDTSNSSRVSRVGHRRRNRPEHKLSPFVVPSWVSDHTDRNDPPRTAPAALDVRNGCTSPETLSSSASVSSSRSLHRRPSPVALADIFDTLSK